MNPSINLQTWETLILKRLNWDVSSILATDYLDHILVKLSQLVAQSSSPSDEHLSFHTSSSSPSSCCTAREAHPGSRPSNILSQSSPFVAISSLPSTKRPLESSPSSSYSSHFATSYSVRSKRRKVEHPSTSLQPATLHETVRRHASTLISLCSTGKSLKGDTSMKGFRRSFPPSMPLVASSRPRNHRARTDLLCNSSLFSLRSFQ